MGLCLGLRWGLVLRWGWVRVRVRVRLRFRVRVRVRLGVRVGARVSVRVGVRVSVRVGVRVGVRDTWSSRAFASASSPPPLRLVAGSETG